MKTPVQSYPSGANKREAAADRSRSAKQAELVRRGSDPANAAHHARNMVGKENC